MELIAERSGKQSAENKVDTAAPFHDELRNYAGFNNKTVAENLPAARLRDQWHLALNKSSLLSNDFSKTAQSEHVPSSKMERAKVVIGEAGTAVMPAVADAYFGVDHLRLPFSKGIVGRDINIPVPKILESAALGAAIGFGTRTLLPQTGILGKVGSAALAVAFTAPLAKQGYDIYNQIDSAKNMSELRQAGAELGTALGSFAANMPVGILSYKAGVYASDRMMVLPSLSGFANAKAQAFDRANDWVADKINGSAELSKRILIGERQHTGSHAVAQEYPRITDSLKEGLKGTDYQLPTVKLDPNLGKGTNVLVVTGHGVEAPEFTEVVKALRNAGANVTVATPDWTWDYQPGNRGKVSLAQWQVNEHTIQADLSVSAASKMMAQGKFDAMYVPGGAGNTAAIRTDSGVQALLRQSLNQNLDTWTICHGGQVFISALEKGSGIKLTGSPDITPQDLPNHGFIVPAENVVFDAGHKLLSGKDPSVLNDFITAIGERLAKIRDGKSAKP